MKENKHILKGGLLLVLAAISLSVNALEKPQTMDDMWKIIQAQQKQIDDMKSALQATTLAKTVVGDALKADAQTTAVAKTTSNEVKTLERKTDVLTREVEKLRTNLTIPDEVQYKSAYGLGPAASKVYQVGKGLSIGGYGEANYQVRVDDQGGREKDTGKDKGQDKLINPDNADLERLVMYVGYKFTDNILFNSEIEFEHGSVEGSGNGNGDVSVEFAALDFFIDPIANVRAGMVLLPMGFLNQIHEPPFYFGNNRPEVERQIIPSTWREIGVGLFGAITPELTYTTYVVNGMDAADFSSAGIRSGRQKGAQAYAEDLAFVGRLDYTPTALPGLTVGGSAYLGNSGQNQLFANQQVDVFTQLYEAHVQWKYRGLEFRTLGSWGHIDDADVLSAYRKLKSLKDPTIGEENYGWYTEVGYDILPLLNPNTSQYLAPFFRYEQLDTIASAPVGFSDDETKDRKIYQFGLQYKPIPNVVIKADYRNFMAKKGPLADDFNLGFGFIF